MRTKTIPSDWLQSEGCRLDVGPYMSGALEAKAILASLSVPKMPLQDLTLGGMGGLVNAGRIKRVWVTDPDHGRPFLSSTDIFQADLSTLRLISNKAVSDNPKLIIRKNWTLITRAGTIGRMAYARPDMHEMACTEDVLRVIPDESKVPAGYLYAYLNSKFGVPLIVSGTYGAIIQHIEPFHVSELPVPRLKKDLEVEIDGLVKMAAVLRVEATRMLSAAISMTLSAWGVSEGTQCQQDIHPDIQVIGSIVLARHSRLDAFFYGHAAQNSDSHLKEIGNSIPMATIGDSAVTRRVFETIRFGRVNVSDPNFGVPFLSISDLVRVDPKPDSLISRRQADSVNALVEAGWLILPRVGQLQGVFGTVCFIPQHLDQVAVSDNNIRIVPVNEKIGAYIWAALSTDICYQQIIRRACGTSIPYLDAKRVASIPMPWPSAGVRHEIASIVIDAMAKRSEASRQEASAVHLVEQAIEEAA